MNQIVPSTGAATPTNVVTAKNNTPPINATPTTTGMAKTPQPNTTVVSAAETIKKDSNAYKILNPFHPRIKYSKPKNLNSLPPVSNNAPTPVVSVPPVVTIPSSATSNAFVAAVAAAQSSILLNATHSIPSTPSILSRQAIADVYQKITGTTLSKRESFEASNEDIHASIMTDLENYAEIDDIELPDGSQIGFDDEYTSQHEDVKRSSSLSMDAKCGDFNSSKYDYCSDSAQSGGGGDEPGRQYMCRHCGKKYRWKSTLRRHENVECGGKEPAHQCPHCPYKAKQRGNLGVHIRKHHMNMPPLESRRKSHSHRNTL